MSKTGRKAHLTVIDDPQGEGADSFAIRDKWVHIYVPKDKKSVVVGKIEGGKYIWDGACESKHTININGKRCWGIDEGLLVDYLLPRKMPIEIRTKTRDVYEISAYDAHYRGLDRQIAGYGRQRYIPLEHFRVNGKPFNES